MTDSTDIVNEYLDPSTSAERKEAIWNEINASGDEDARILIELKESIDLAPELDQFQARLSQLEPKPARFTPLRIAASIAFVFLTSVTVYLVSQGGKTSSKALFQSHFFPYDGYTITRGAEENLIAQGIEAYESDQFEAALESFQAVYTEENAELNLLISSCYLKLNDASNAMIYLYRIKSTEGSIITYNRDWYLALTYLALGNTQQSKELLRQITSSGSPFQSNAEDLLQEKLFEDDPPPDDGG